MGGTTTYQINSAPNNDGIPLTHGTYVLVELRLHARLNTEFDFSSDLNAV